MQFDTTKLPNKLWLAPSEVTLAIADRDASIHEHLAAHIENELASGALKLCGRRAVAVEVKIEHEPAEPEDPAEPEGAVRGEINLYGSGITWVDREYDERLGPSDEPINTVMRPAGDPETIEPYYLCGKSTVDWEADQLRCEGGPEWHEVRFERGGLVKWLNGQNAGTPREKRKPGSKPYYNESVIAEMARSIAKKPQVPGVTPPTEKLIEKLRELHRTTYPNAQCPSRSTVQRVLNKYGLP